MIGSSYMSRMYFQFSVQYGYSFRIKAIHSWRKRSADAAAEHVRNTAAANITYMK